MNFEFNPSDVSLFEFLLMLRELRSQFCVRFNDDVMFQSSWVVGMIKPDFSLTLDKLINDRFGLNWVGFVKFILLRMSNLKSKEVS